jgi:hypothetical protein
MRDSDLWRKEVEDIQIPSMKISKVRSVVLTSEASPVREQWMRKG